MNLNRFGQPVPEIWPEQVPVSTGHESIIGLNRVKPIMRHLKSHQNSKTSAMVATSSAQDHIGHIRTCSEYPRGSGQFLTWTKTHHATLQMTSEFKNKCNGGYVKCPWPHWPHPDMFRVPPGKWLVFDLNQNPSCDTKNYIRI